MEDGEKEGATHVDQTPRGLRWWSSSALDWRQDEGFEGALQPGFGSCFPPMLNVMSSCDVSDRCELVRSPREDEKNAASSAARNQRSADVGVFSGRGCHGWARSRPRDHHARSMTIGSHRSGSVAELENVRMTDVWCDTLSRCQLLGIGRSHSFSSPQTSEKRSVLGNLTDRVPVAKVPLVAIDVGDRTATCSGMQNAGSY